MWFVIHISLVTSACTIFFQMICFVLSILVIKKKPLTVCWRFSELQIHNEKENQIKAVWMWHFFLNPNIIKVVHFLWNDYELSDSAASKALQPLWSICRTILKHSVWRESSKDRPVYQLDNHCLEMTFQSVMQFLRFSL